MEGRPQRPLRHGARSRAPGSRKEAVSLEWQRILELAGNHEAGTRDDLPRGRAIEALEVSNVDGLLAPGPPSRRAVRLERYLHDRRLARASHLGEHAN